MTIEYEGTRYSGWQAQKNARTVQGELSKAIGLVTGTTQFEFHASGRTDAGVHALQQVAHLDVKTVLAPEILRMKMNDELPADINVLEIERTSPTFHARHDAVARSYLYQIARRRTAFGKRYVWWIKDALDVTAMKGFLPTFVGMKNFQSFTADDPEEKSTKVLVQEMQMMEAGDLLLVRMVGSHFLWKMVRQLIGVLAAVGRGAVDASQVEQWLRIASDEPARFTAPPSGLFLEQVYYRGDRPRPLRSVINIGG
jgi:tRNA pseudouridine38-40 synthase